MCKKLARWKANFLSRGGRVTLIKATLANIPVYFLSLFVIPTQVVLQIKKIQRDFLWNGGGNDKGLYLVVWDRVCSPKFKGGLGLRSMEVMNKALLFKWLWRFGREEDSV